MSNTVLPQAKFLHYAEHSLSWITMLSCITSKTEKMDNSKWPQLVLLPGNSACLHLFGQEYSLSVSESMHFSVWESVHEYMHAYIHALVCCFISSCFVLLQCIINSSMQYVLLNYVIACVWYVCKSTCYVCIKINKRTELALQGTRLLTIENSRQKKRSAWQLPTSPRKKKFLLNSKHVILLSELSKWLSK